MAEFTEVIKHKNRMCKKYDDGDKCLECPLSAYKIHHSCFSFTNFHSEESEKIIMDWAKEHPIVTNRDKLKETFGKDVKFKGCEGFECPTNNTLCNECNFNCFWEKEYKAPEAKQ